MKKHLKHKFHFHLFYFKKKIIWFFYLKKTEGWFYCISMIVYLIHQLAIYDYLFFVKFCLNEPNKYVVMKIFKNIYWTDKDNL